MNVLRLAVSLISEATVFPGLGIIVLLVLVG